MIGVTIHRVTAFEHAYETAKRYSKMPSVRDVDIVHGVVRTPYNGKEFVHYWHAWVEINGTTCIEDRPGLRLSLPREAYYKANRIKDDPASLRRYTIKSFESLHSEYGHYGPFPPPPSNTEGTADVVTSPPATASESVL